MLLVILNPIPLTPFHHLYYYYQQLQEEVF